MPFLVSAVGGGGSGCSSSIPPSSSASLLGHSPQGRLLLGELLLGRLLLGIDAGRLDAFEADVIVTELLPLVHDTTSCGGFTPLHKGRKELGISAQVKACVRTDLHSIIGLFMYVCQILVFSAYGEMLF